MNIATVLRSGGDYRPEHVIALHDQVMKHNPDSLFLCITDTPINHEGINEIANDEPSWHGWWAKLLLFKHFRNIPVIYLDLDTMVFGDLSVFQSEGFTMLADFYRHHTFGSGVMSWNGDLIHIHDAFKANAYKFMLEYKTREKWGDQGFIRDHANMPISTFTENGSIISYKAHVLNGLAKPEDCNILCFHGNPRPWQTDLWRFAQ